MNGPIEFQNYGLQYCLDIGFRMNTKRMTKYIKCLVLKYCSFACVPKKSLLPKENLFLIDFLNDNEKI